MLKNLKSSFRKNIWGMRVMLIYHRIRAFILLRLSDEQFAKRMYYKYPGKYLDLKNPKTFDEKQWWLKIHYRNPLMVQCTDKVDVRNYLKAAGCEDILNTVYGVYENANDIDWNKLPDSFFIKTNNSSGTNLYCSSKKNADKKKINRLFNLYLKVDHYSLSREWNYKEIEPRIIIENVLKDSNGDFPLDYRFLCFSGEPKLIFLDIGTANKDGTHAIELYRNVYNMNFELLPFKVTRENFISEEIIKPKNFDKMAEIAGILSRPFPFCRVDLYNVEGKIYFGEITFFHAGGCNNVQPNEWDTQLGEWIDIGNLSC